MSRCVTSPGFGCVRSPRLYRGWRCSKLRHRMAPNQQRFWQGGLTEGRGSGKDSKRAGYRGNPRPGRYEGIIIPGIPGHHWNNGWNNITTILMNPKCLIHPSKLGKKTHDFNGGVSAQGHDSSKVLFKQGSLYPIDIQIIQSYRSGEDPEAKSFFKASIHTDRHQVWLEEFGMSREIVADEFFFRNMLNLDQWCNPKHPLIATCWGSVWLDPNKHTKQTQFTLGGMVDGRNPAPLDSNKPW